jgi:ribose transport system substrate-binding protein
VDRADAFEHALARNAPGIHLAEKLVGSFSFGQAEQAAEASLHAHPHLSAIVAMNVNATRGAYAAVHAAGLSGRVKILGWDQALDLLFLLRHGQIDAMVIENTRAMGYLAVEEIVAETDGRSVPPYLYVQPELVTRENIDDERIQHMLDMDWRNPNWQPNTQGSTQP